MAKGTGPGASYGRDAGWGITLLVIILLVLVFWLGTSVDYRPQVVDQECEPMQGQVSMGKWGRLVITEFEHAGHRYRCIADRDSGGWPGGLWCELRSKHVRVPYLPED